MTTEREDVLGLKVPVPKPSRLPATPKPYADLLAGVATQLGLTRRTVREVVELFVLDLSEAVWKRGRFVVPELGAFAVRKRKERLVVDRRIGSFVVPAHQVVTARVAKSWRRRG